MSLGTPWMLLLLPLVVLAGWLMARGRRLQHVAGCNLKGVAPGNAVPRLGRRDWLVLSALACTALALARPHWNPRPDDVERKGRDLVIALDVSRSMLAADVLPSRLEVARIAIHEALPAWTGQRIALITFAGSAAVRVPPTLDHDFVRYMLERADPSDMDLGSTSLQSAVQQAVSAVLTDAAGGRRDLVILTDGEDHLSNLDQTAEMLAQCGARVLIIGLGDPVRGARVPAVTETDRWLRHNDAEVVSRLDERTLEKLCGKSERVTYYPARTRPFDLVRLYQQLVSGAAADVVVGELRQVHYTEGYPYLLALSVGLWWASASWRWPAARPMAVILLLLPGCGRPRDDGGEAAFQAKSQQGAELLEHAQEQSAVDLLAARSLLLDAREAWLRAALLRPGDLDTARRITVATRRLRELEAAIEKQRDDEQKRHEGLAEIIEQLEQLTLRQARLAQQSTRLLTRRLVPPRADLSASSDRDNEMLDDLPTASSTSDSRLAPPAAEEQQAVQQGTAQLLDGVTFQRNTLRQLLGRAYGDVGQQSPTELDPVVELLSGARSAQQQALASLVPPSVSWPTVNTAFHTAAGRMQQALEALRGLQPPAKDQPDNAMPPSNDYDENAEAADTDAEGKLRQPAPAADFASALALRSLPIPQVTSAEILAEEAANQQQRARQNAARAAAKVEKNW